MLKAAPGSPYLLAGSNDGKAVTLGASGLVTVHKYLNLFGLIG